MKQAGVLICLMAIGFMACESPVTMEEETTGPLFTDVAADSSNVNFTNTLTFDQEFNIYTYRNFYNGGGVALGDVNNDGLLDIYFTGNRVPNALYINQGDFKFKDVTESAGVAGERAWSTGVSMADVNADGWVDIYVCNSGDISGDNKQNELFINNGDGTFTEKAEEYGLADRGFSTHAAFFDYDKDGDLDVYLLNNSYQAIGSFNLMQNKRPERDPVGGDKLYRNDKGKFTDVSEEAGIYGSIIGFGLGVTVGDVNNDSWPDMFISNDFFERDYLYINKQDGTFEEVLESSMKSISAASMGADMADINNDGWMDIFVTDMLPESLERLKQVTTFENWDKITYNVNNGYHHQYTRNMLHLNNQDGSYSEIGRLAGVEATDWSWGALIFDMDNDGRKDIFVANGIYQDITDLDYLNFIYDDETKQKIITETGVDYKGLIDPIPVNPVSNYAFLNQGDLSFANRAEELGLGVPVHSNGSAYGDIDNDGDLDLVVNNINAVSQVFENNAVQNHPEHGFLRIELSGVDGNTAAVGTRITAIIGEEVIIQEQQPTRGFESSVDPVVHFGLGEVQQVDELRVLWPDNRETIMTNVAVNQTLKLQQADAGISNGNANPGVQTILTLGNFAPSYSHEENLFVDFDRDRLTYHMRSNEGPASATGDVNGDGLMDLYMGGSAGTPGQIFLQRPSGQFTPDQVFAEDERSEDTDAIFVDVDGDGDNDLVVASGGNEFGFLNPVLKNRLYINDGSGNFEKSLQPSFTGPAESTSVIVAADADGDGDQDLFVGSRLVPFKYGIPADSHLLINNGSGTFTDATESLIPTIAGIGMVTDAAWGDVDGDNDQDLLVVGEWMTPQLFINEEEGFVRESVIDTLSGWYSSLLPMDVDADGDLDFLLGNLGMNNRFKASVENSLLLYVADFDNNGAIEHVYAKKIDDLIYPITLKHQLEMQVPSLKKKYLKYASYNNQRIDQIFTQDQLKGATILEITELRSGVLINDGEGYFSWQALPKEAQFSPVYAFAKISTTGSETYVLGGGNQYRVKPEVGRYDASRGFMLSWNSDGFETIPAGKSGFVVDGEIRGITRVNESSILVIKNDAAPDAFSIQ